MQRTQDGHMYVPRLKKFIMWSIMLFTLLSSYATAIVGFTLGDALLIVVILIVMFDVASKRRNINKIVSKPILIFLFYIFMFTLVYAIFKPEILRNGALATTRYIMYLFVVAICAKYYVEREYIIAIYIKLAVLLSFYIFIQFTAYYLIGLVIPSAIPGLPITYENISANEYLVKSYLLYRPSSLFVEPAHFAAFQIPVLFLILNCTVYGNKRWSIAGIITIGLLLSGSSTAIIMLIICWIKPVLRTLLKIKIKSLVSISLLLIIVAIILKSSYAGAVLERLIDIPISEQGSSIAGRLGNINYLFSDTISAHQKIFGFGFGYKTGFYLPSYGTLLLYMGYTGLAMFMITMIYVFFRLSKEGKSLMIIFLIMFIGTNVLFGVTSVLYFTLLFSDVCMKEKIKNVGGNRWY